MLRILTALVLFCTCTGVNAQDSAKQFVKKIYYNTNEYLLSTLQRSELDELLRDISKYRVRSVKIEANTDSVGSAGSNDTLSYRRAAEVKRYLLEKIAADEKLIELSWNGELKPVAANNSEEGRQQNRRTDVSVVATISVLPEIACDGDTLISFPKGTVLKMKKCEYERLKECLSVKEIFSPEDIVGTDLTTMTINGALLVSCGMIDISLDKNCKDSCFRHPVTVMMPARPAKRDSCASCGIEGQLYFFAGNGTWSGSSASPGEMEIVKLNGKDYYQFTITCPGKYNCDCPKPSKKVTFKVKNGLRIEKLELIYECPLVVSRFESEPATRKLKTKAFCYETRKLINVVAVDTKGNRFYITRQSLEKYEFRASRPPCKAAGKKTVIRKFLFWKFFKAPIYRKYILHKRDFAT